MFGRSQSGPGGLSINTASANTFPPQSNPPPPSDAKATTSLFGALGTPQPQQSSTTPQAQQTSSLFGSTSQAQPSGSLFGSSATSTNNQPPPQQQQSSNLFGTTQGTQATGGGLFGSQTPQQQPGGLFGSLGAPNPQPMQGGGLFGSLGQKKDASQPPQSSLFGGLNNQSKPSLFGNPPAPNQNQQTAFQAPNNSLFSSQIGQQGKQQTVPGVAVNINELRPTTRFNDCHQDLQKAIENIDAFILGQIRKSEDCFAANDTIEALSLSMPADIEYCAKSLDTMQQALENDAQSIAFARSLVKADYGDAVVSFRVIQNLSLPQQFHHSSLQTSASVSRNQALLLPEHNLEGTPANIVDYFTKQANEMTKTLATYDRNISEVENYLKGVESKTMQQTQQMMFNRTREGGSQSAEDQVRELAVVLREFGNGIIGVASKVGDTRETIQEVMLGP